MRPVPDLARVAALIADPSRAVMLDTLMDGIPRPVRELARDAKIALSTASEHVATLERGGLVATARVGRERRVWLRDATVARTLEQFANLAGGPSGVDTTAMARLRSARTCYDHLAGRLGVGLADALVERGALLRGDEAFAVAPAGRAWFDSIGIDLDVLAARSRSFSRACLDWTERRPHVAGSLGAALARRAFELGWVVRLPGSRALLLTPDGQAFLEEAFGPGAGWPSPDRSRRHATATISAVPGFYGAGDRSTRSQGSAPG